MHECHSDMVTVDKHSLDTVHEPKWKAQENLFTFDQTVIIIILFLLDTVHSSAMRHTKKITAKERRMNEPTN